MTTSNLVLSQFLDAFALSQANTLRKSNVILWLYCCNLSKLLSANVDGT